MEGSSSALKRTLEVQKDLLVCCVDYTKAFDNVKRDEIMKMLQDIDIDDTDMRIYKKKT